jgi:hypothetical protein
MTSLAPYSDSTDADWRELVASRKGRRAPGVLRAGSLAKQALVDAAAHETSIDEVGRSATFVISTPTPDRSEDVVNPVGVQLGNYRKNPVVFFDHGFSGIHVPIGKCEDETGNLALAVSDEGIEATCFFADSTEGEQIFDLVKQGVLRCASINMTPLAYQIRAEGSSGRPGMQIDEWELLEWSIVGIPDNPEAVRKVLAGGRLAGLPICDPILKSLRSLAPRLDTGTPGLGGGIFKMGDDSDTDSGMEMSHPDTTISGNPDATLDEDDDGSVVKPPGAKAIEECHAHLKSAHNVLERHAGMVEQPSVKKCIRKVRDDVKNSMADLCDCYSKEYADLGTAALDADEDQPAITSKNAVRRLAGQIRTVRELHIRFRRQTNWIRKLKPAEQEAAIVRLQTEFSRGFDALLRSLSAIHDESTQTAGDEGSDLVKKLNDRLSLIETKVTAAAGKLLEAIPHRTS